jgi:acetyl esterase/lipase
MNFPLLALVPFFMLPAQFDSSVKSISPSPTPVPGPAPTPIYTGAAPGALGSQEKDAPHVLEYLPSPGTTPATAVIICPGGGYAGLSFDFEGRTEANWFAAHGIAAFVLQYRLPSQGYRHPVPMQDGQRAIRWVRSHAAEFHVDPNKIGIMGFSAGGHLASTQETHFDSGQPGAADPVDRVSCRPDFAILVYAVITMKDGETHRGSRDNLLGPNPDPALVANLSNDTQVTAQTPPTILFAAQDDHTVPIQNSRDMYAALQRAGVPSELHEYPQGGHGFGFRPPNGKPQGWFDVDLYGWLKKMGFAS